MRLFDEDASSPREALCVQGAAKGRAAVLVPVDSAGTVGAPIEAAVHRANRRSLQARFAPATVGLKAGDSYRWQVQSAWDGSSDQVPDKGAVDASLAQPQAVGCKAGGASYRTERPARQEGRGADLRRRPGAADAAVLQRARAREGAGRRSS